MVVEGYVVGVCDADEHRKVLSYCYGWHDPMLSKDVRQGSIGVCTAWLISPDVYIMVSERRGRSALPARARVGGFAPGTPALPGVFRQIGLAHVLTP